MIINDLLEKEKMSRYRLSKESGVAMTTITDICNGKADLDKCTAGTLHKIARVLNVTVDLILEIIVQIMKIIDVRLKLLRVIPVIT